MAEEAELQLGPGLIDFEDGRFSPAAERFLADKGADGRRRFLQGLRERLQTEGSPVVLCGDGDRPLIAYAVGLGDPARCDYVHIVDLQDLPVPPVSVLCTLFDLTTAEARLAQRLAKGECLDDAARALDIEITTARSQLAAIFEKTAMRRQAKLVAMLSRVAHLA